RREQPHRRERDLKGAGELPRHRALVDTFASEVEPPQTRRTLHAGSAPMGAVLPATSVQPQFFPAPRSTPSTTSLGASDSCPPPCMSLSVVWSPATIATYRDPSAPACPSWPFSERPPSSS